MYHFWVSVNLFIFFFYRSRITGKGW